MVRRLIMKVKTALGTGLKVIYATFWQRTCLHFPHILQLYVRGGLEMTHQLALWKKFQGISASRMWFQYCCLISARFTVRLRKKKKYQRKDLRNLLFDHQRKACRGRLMPMGTFKRLASLKIIRALCAQTVGKIMPWGDLMNLKYPSSMGPKVGKCKPFIWEEHPWVFGSHG